MIKAEATGNGEETENLLACRDLHLGYPGKKGWKAVVHGLDFAVPAGETVAIVGESGSGKSTTAKALVKLVPVRQGSIRYRGEEIAHLDPLSFRPFRKRIQLVFQDPWQALNPRLDVASLLAEPLRLHFPEMKGDERRRRIRELLDQVHLPSSSLDRYPAEFSGGQRQRILMARAIAVEPELLICDEPVSALDVSIQAKLLDLITELKAAQGLTVIFISHDLAVVQQMADRVLVMQNGHAVEWQAADTLFSSPGHPYTRMLIDACPKW